MDAHKLAPRSFNRKCYTNAQGRRVCDGLPVGAIVAMVLALVIILPLGFMLACRSRRRRAAPPSVDPAHPQELPYDVEAGGMQQRLDSTAYLEKVLSDTVPTPKSAPPPYAVPHSPSVAAAGATRSTSQRSMTPPAAPAPVVMRGWPIGLIAASQRPPSTGASAASTPAGSPRMGHRRQLSGSGHARQHSRHGSASAPRTTRDERRNSRREHNAASVSASASALAGPFTDGAAAAQQPSVLAPRSDGRI